MIYSFDDIRINTDSLVMTRDGQIVHAEPLTLNLIIYLITQRDRAVSRGELFDVLWKGRCVSDASLSNEIKEARKVLGDTGRQQCIIRTVHGHGYQFVSILNEADSEKGTPSPLIDPGDNLFESIPLHSTRFIGRSIELQVLKEILDNSDNRLVSILGPGGIGKTSLAIQLAHEVKENYEGGIYFIPLVTELRASNVILHIAKSLKIPDQIFSSEESRQRVSKLANFIPAKKQLIILDGFEHLLDAVEELSWLCAQSDHIQFVITTRERTNLLNEHTVILEGLSHSNAFNSESTEIDDAVSLFLDRASNELNETTLLQDHKIDIGKICHRLGGSPLGIVMAASWLRIMSVETLASEISYSMLKNQDTPLKLEPRHQKINNLFESSWTRLSDDLQQIFMKLSVFTGGFTIESAAGVCDCSLDQLMKLEQLSLIKKYPDGWFSVHELLRQFGEEKLKDSLVFDATLMKMVGYFIKRAKKQLPYIITRNNLELLKVLRQELPNFYKVCRIIVSLTWWEDVCDLIIFNGYVDNQVPRWFDINRKIIPMLQDKVPVKHYIKVLRQLLDGYRLMNIGDLVRLNLSKEYIEIGKTLEHKGIEGEGYSFLYDCYHLQPEPNLDHHQYLENAYACYKEHMDNYTGPENSEMVYYAIHLGDESASTERWDDCKYYYLLAMSIAERVGNQRLHEICYWGAALGYLLTNEPINGLLYCQRSLHSYLELENYLAYANRIPGVALGARLFCDYEQSVRILGQAQGLIERITRRAAPVETFTNQEDINILKQALGITTYQNIWQAGKEEKLSLVVSYVNQYIDSKCG